METKEEKIRTIQQNKALWKYFDALAQEFSDHGLDMKKVLKPEIDIPWNKDTICEFLWKPIMKIQTGKESTTELTTKEIELFLSQPDEKTLKGVRDKAMLEFAYATGMKVSEIIGLSIKDINLKDEYVICNEGYRRRVIPLGKISVSALRRYLEEARPFLINSDEESTLFVNLTGTQLTRQGFWKIIKQYKNQANIESDITPHVLRHSFATHLLQNGADIHAIQNMMGHADISSTEIYLQFMPDDISSEYKNALPRA